MSESVQYAVILPLLMLATLGIIQAGVWLHGHNVAARSARAAVDVARGSFGSTAAAEEQARDLADAGGLDAVQVTVTRGAGRVAAEVSATSPLILPIGLGRITESASAPVERVTPP